MRSQALSGGASVGLSALVAGLLLVAAKRDYPIVPLTSFEMRTKPAAPSLANTQRRADAPTAVVLPDPPPATTQNNVNKTLKLSKATMKPMAVTKNNPAPAIVPIRPRVKQVAPMFTVRPLQPSQSSPADKMSVSVDKDVPAQPNEVISQNLKAKNAVVIVRPSEDPKQTEEGRVLLKMLEHGHGPVIELAWPDRAKDQERLYKTLRDCLGMRVALRDVAGRLYTGNATSGQAWQPNVDRYSGFARQPTGRLAAAEHRDILKIGRQHNLSRQTSAIRIFPRRIDAQLLGGLRRLVGESYRGVGNIRADYRLTGSGVLITNIQANGRPIAGSVALGGPIKSDCGKS